MKKKYILWIKGSRSSLNENFNLNFKCEIIDKKEFEKNKEMYFSCLYENDFQFLKIEILDDEKSLENKVNKYIEFYYKKG